MKRLMPKALKIWSGEFLITHFLENLQAGALHVISIR
jgi:hypothetical protein